jgi:tRNA pseudouridine38-40 synthase
MPSFKLTLAYDGTAYVGWQRQSSGTSVQGLLEEALAQLDGAAVQVTGAGRTDSGVHALGQVAMATLQRAVDESTVVRAANARLPDTIRVLDATEVGVDFHPRFRALAKTYRYRLWNADVLDPFERAYAWHLPWPRLDVDAMTAAAAMIEGRHDFAGFQGAGSDTRTTEREVFSSRVERLDDRPLITYEVRGNGFLRYMVRNIVGTLVDVGRGRHRAGWIADVLASRDREKAGPTAPAHGLFLVRVEYASMVQSEVYTEGR